MDRSQQDEPSQELDSTAPPAPEPVDPVAGQTSDPTTSSDDTVPGQPADLTTPAGSVPDNDEVSDHGVAVGAESADPVTAPLVVLTLPEYPSAPLTAPIQLRPVRDPLAVAVGNASLLGLGYVLLRRWWLAALTVLVTVGLVVAVALAEVTWLEFVVVGWWLALIAHGWFLAGGKPHPTPPPGTRTHRLVAAAFAVVVLATFGVLRWDSARIDDEVTAAKADGDCARAVDALRERSVGNRVANAPLSAEGDELLRACGVVGSAQRRLHTALSGDTTALASGYQQLRGVLRGHPDREAIVATTLDGFLGKLPTKDSCDTATITDRLADVGGLLDRAARVVAKVAPKAFVDCADQLMKAGNWPKARDWYQQLVDQYPDSDLKARATQGITKATQAIELDNVTSLLSSAGPSSQPAYCSSPAPYSAAPPYPQPGPNLTMLYGNDEYLSMIPGAWKTGNVGSAVAIMCAGETEEGAPTQTCPYTEIDTGIPSSITFYQIRIPVKLYEVRTGRLLADTVVEIGGSSCPDYLFSYGSSEYVTPSENDVALAFQGLLVLP